MQDQIASAKTKAKCEGDERGWGEQSTTPVSRHSKWTNAPASDNLRARVGRRGDLVAGGRAQTGERLRDEDAYRNGGGAVDQ